MSTAGCGAFRERARDAAAASPGEIQHLLSVVDRRNQGLETFKGIGKAYLTDGRKSNAVRLAWLGSRPDKIRFEVMGIPGQSSASLSFDGNRYYVLSHRDGTLLTGDSDGLMFESLTSIPVGARDVVDLMSGRVPEYDFDSAAVEIDDITGREVLVLERGWFGESEKIYFNNDKTDIQKFEMYNFAGTLVYSAEFKNMRAVKEFRLPFVLGLTGDDGVSLRIEAERYYANIPVAQSTFVLTPYDGFKKSDRP